MRNLIKKKLVIWFSYLLSFWSLPPLLKFILKVEMMQVCSRSGLFILRYISLNQLLVFKHKYIYKTIYQIEDFCIPKYSEDIQDWDSDSLFLFQKNKILSIWLYMESNDFN